MDSSYNQTKCFHKDDLTQTFIPLEELVGGYIVDKKEVKGTPWIEFTYIPFGCALVYDYVKDVDIDLEPTRGSEEAAGYDLKSSVFRPIPPMRRSLVQTGIKVSIPKGYYGQIFPRSGLALKSGIMTMAGVIDSDYTGEIGVILFNSGDTTFNVKPGDRIAQMVILKCESFPVRRGNVSGTARGTGGFGSTGQ